MRRVTALALLVLLASLLVAGAAQAKPLSASDRAMVDEIVAEEMEAGRLPGLEISISGPRGDYTQTYGLADRASGRRLALDDHVRIASITKTFTATAVLLQVKKGRLSLADKLSEYIKGIPNGDRVTLREMLAMRSGIYSYTNDPKFDQEFEADPRMKFGLADVLAIVRRHDPEFEPNAKTVYSDTNYYLLGAILEKVTGMSVARAITTEVIRPLGLKHTSYPTSTRIPSPFARGYYAGPEGKDPVRDYTAVNPAVAGPAGAMISTLGDLRKYGRALAQGALLGPKLQRARLRFGVIPNGSGPSVGYGLGILHVGDWLGHDGAIFGFSSETFFNPKNGAQIVSAANLSSNFSTPTLDVFIKIVARLYPASLTTGG